MDIDSLLRENLFNEKVEKTSVSEEVDNPVISIILNRDKESGKIKLFTKNQLDELYSIESILSKFDLEKAPKFEEKLTLTIKSPLSQFSGEEYKIVLMDGVGELYINNDDFSDVVTEKSVTNVEQAIGDNEKKEKEEQAVNLDYLSSLNYDYQKIIKNNFFTRVMQNEG